MAWEENSRICLHTQLIAILSRIGVSYTSKTIENILSLQSQLRLLTEARDRLLPKLLSGEIEV